MCWQSLKECIGHLFHTSYCKLNNLNTDIYYLTVSLGQEYRHSLASAFAQGYTGCYEDTCWTVFSSGVKWGRIYFQADSGHQQNSRPMVVGQRALASLWLLAGDSLQLLEDTVSKGCSQFLKASHIFSRTSAVP